MENRVNFRESLREWKNEEEEEGGKGGNRKNEKKKRRDEMEKKQKIRSTGEDHQSASLRSQRSQVPRFSLGLQNYEEPGTR